MSPVTATTQTDFPLCALVGRKRCVVKTMLALSPRRGEVVKSPQQRAAGTCSSSLACKPAKKPFALPPDDGKRHYQ